MREASELTDLKNGATEKTEETEETEKTLAFFSVLFVGSVALLLRSGTYALLRCLSEEENVKYNNPVAASAKPAPV